MGTLSTFEMLMQMKNGAIATKTTKDMYDERLQSATIRESGKLHKNEKGATFKSLPLKILVIPFNPFTGETDKEYNNLTPFISTKSVTSAIKAIKLNANTTESAKKAFMEIAGISEWDTSDSETVNKVDLRIFNLFMKPRQFTIPTFSVTYPSMLNKDAPYGFTFGLTCERDPITKDIVGDIPEVLQIGQLHRALNKERIDRYTKLYEEGSIKDTKVVYDATIEGWKAGIGISWEKRSNFLATIEYKEEELKKVVDKDTREVRYELLPTITAENLKDHFVYLRVTGTVNTALEKFSSEDNYEANMDPEYYDMTIECGKSGDKKEVGKATTYAPTSSVKVLNGKNGHDVLERSLIELLDSIKDQEDMCKNSAYIRVYTDKTHETVLGASKGAIGELIDDMTYGDLLTSKIFEKYKDIIQLLFPERFNKLSMKFVTGKMAEGKEVDEAGLIKEGKDAGYSVDAAASGESAVDLTKGAEESNAIKDVTEGLVEDVNDGDLNGFEG